ncbi:FAR1-related sequence 5-like protein [Tanacetum coccineum]
MKSLASLKSTQRVWDGVAETRKELKDSLIKKEPGHSFIEVQGVVEKFIVGRILHSRIQEIVGVLKVLSFIEDGCESCHNQAERLLDSVREMEDLIAIKLRWLLLCGKRLQRSRRNKCKAEYEFDQEEKVTSDRLDVQIVRVKDHVGYYIVDDDGNRTWYPDNDIGDKPLEGCEFVSIDQAYAFYKDYGKRAGFDVRKGGDDDKLVGLFWADEQAIRDYAVFGDIVSFDATFRSNKYKMVFVPFTGINHHNRCITFASGLLSDETVGAYKWLLEEFKNAFGKDPNVVITDQDPSMKIAIPECFPNTRHRLCMWHIMQKLVTKVGTAICNKTDFKRRICDIVWTYQILPYEFEREWEIMIKDFQLDDNKWLQDMFDIRESWIPAFLRDELMAGLMRTTSRYIERKNDHDSRYKNPKLKTDLQMEKEASTFYTRTVFFDVQDEIYASYSHCMSVNVVQVDNAKKYSIRDMQAENRIRGDNNFVVYQILYHVDGGDFMRYVMI